MTICARPRAAVDVLFVVDSGASMAQAATRLQQEMVGVAGRYATSGLDLRLAVVDASPAGGPHGEFVSTPCSARLDAFVGTPDPGARTVDIRRSGCTDRCPRDELGVLPSRVLGDQVHRARPWLTVEGGWPQLEPGWTFGEDLACRVPLGLDGATSTSALEAMRLALARAEDPADPAYGFLRGEANLFVMFVTDRDDAGTTPIDDYVELLAAIERDKLEHRPELSRAVFVSVVGGVALHDDADELAVACEGPLGRAAPATRLMELATRFAEFEPWQRVPGFPICHSGWADALACVPIFRPFPFACEGAPLLDADPDTEVVDPVCEVEWFRDRLPPAPLRSCLDDDGEPRPLEADEVACFDVVVDPYRDEYRDRACSLEVPGDLDLRFAPGFGGDGCFRVTCRVEPRPRP